MHRSTDTCACCASSRVGATMHARNPKARGLRSAASTGTTYAMVLPEPAELQRRMHQSVCRAPVGAPPRISRPAAMMGMACDCEYWSDVQNKAATAYLDQRRRIVGRLGDVTSNDGRHAQPAQPVKRQQRCRNI